MHIDHCHRAHNICIYNAAANRAEALHHSIDAIASVVLTRAASVASDYVYERAMAAYEHCRAATYEHQGRRAATGASMPSAAHETLSGQACLKPRLRSQTRCCLSAWNAARQLADVAVLIVCDFSLGFKGASYDSVLFVYALSGFGMDTRWVLD